MVQNQLLKHGNIRRGVKIVLPVRPVAYDRRPVIDKQVGELWNYLCRVDVKLIRVKKTNSFKIGS